DRPPLSKRATGHFALWKWWSVPGSAADARGFERQALAAPGEVELERHEVGRIVGRHLGAHAVEARAEAPLQRAGALPLEAVRGPAGGMPLADGLGEERLSPAHVMAQGARHVELADALEVEIA